MVLIIPRKKYDTHEKIWYNSHHPLRFDNLYVCSLTRVSGENLRALDVQHSRGTELETLSAGRIQVIQDAEQLQMLF